MTNSTKTKSDVFLVEKIVVRDVASLRVYRRNARSHSDKQIRKLAAGISELGFVVPILVDSRGSIIAGHCRLAAAKLLGLKQVPTILVDHLSDGQIKALRLADNKMAELATWDVALLAEELQELVVSDLDFDIEITGFSTTEIDLRIESSEDAENDECDEVPATEDDGTPVTRAGDLWNLDNHRIICGDARDPGVYERLLEDELAQVVFTDPPYNVPIDRNVCGSGSIHHPEFMMASGEMTADEFITFLRSGFVNLARYSAPASIHYIFMDWRHIREIEAAGADAYTTLKNLVVWVKNNGGMGSFYRSQHELVFVFQSGEGRPINNFGLGGDGRHRTNVWEYAGVNTFRRGRLDDLARHPTAKPTALVADAIKDCSKRGGIVLDAFAGSGTTIIAAEKTGRVARAIELDPRYVDVSVRRWQTFAGSTAHHAATGLSFVEMGMRREASTDLPAEQPVRTRTRRAAANV